ncbi:MAG: DNA polymerase III subunit alpha [Chlorobi bacterium]|nr:DNA polymerase III subunit alpha [Chlorobiota bacterium]
MYLCHSYHSLRYGTLSPEELVAAASSLDIDTLVLTDINSTSGVFNFVKTCQTHNIKPVIGIEFRIDNKLQFTCIAKNNEGFREMNEILTAYNITPQPPEGGATGINSHDNLSNQKPQNQLTYEPTNHKTNKPTNQPTNLQIYQPANQQLKNCLIIYPFGLKTPEALKENEFTGIRPSEVNQLLSSPYLRHPEKLIITHPVTFRDNDSYILHKHLRAIDRNTLLANIDTNDLAGEDETFIPPDELISKFSDYPDIIENKKKLLSSCSFEFDFKSIKNKQTFTGSKEDDIALLTKLAFDGLEYRYGRNNPTARARVEKELDIISRMGFASYFLITWDIIRYSMSRGFYHVGRGSGANSVVAYCLKITDVDPIELDLYFERFLNPKRTSPPDFDIDYSWKERDEVQDYIFKRYGREHTALLGAMSTFQPKAAIRELGKVYGLPKEEIDKLVSHPESYTHDTVTKQILDLAVRIKDFPNLRTIHAGGILISEKPLACYTALDLPPKGFPTTQFDMYTAEDIGFEKLDILSQRGIGHIKDCVEIVKENRGISIDIHNVEKFKKDPKVKKLLQHGETIGCFYIESPAMRGLLKKLRCDNYLTLVAASSIIRPGVAKSGMMREYIKRFHKPDSFEYLHPVMKEQLQETYGVMVYQEDVLKVCHHYAGLDLADADVLRRAMSGKYRSRKEFQRIKDKFFRKSKAKGRPENITAEVWRQIESFAGYSFSKAHSASYAVESFQSLYLKAHFPLEFMTAVINNFGGFYHTSVYINEAKRWGANIELPCVNNSNQLTTIKGKDIYPGFIHIQNLEESTARRIVTERKKNGPYSCLDDFIRRIAVSREQMIILIRTGAFRFTGKNKAELLWELHSLTGKKEPQQQPDTLFASPKTDYRLPNLSYNKKRDAYDEIELLGFPVTLSLFDMLQTKFRSEVFARDMLANAGKTVRMLGELVTIKYVKTSRKEIMYFGTFIDARGEFFDTVHFPPSLKQYPFKGYGVYLLLGRIVEEFGYPMLEVEKMAKMGYEKVKGKSLKVESI